jgi:uncharacterized spore protein YtfJ
MDIEALLTKVNAEVHGGRSFGPAVERDGCTLVPAAWVISVGGAGGGEGGAPDSPDGGSGGGGGHVNVSWPIGAYVIRGGDVRWVSAIDASRVLVALVALAATLVKIRSKRRPSAA